MLRTNNHQLIYDDPLTGIAAPLCEEVSVVERRVDLLTGDITLVISLWVRGEEKRFEVERGELNSTIPAKFFQQGLTILPLKENLEVLMEHLFETDERAPTTYFHEQLGFHEVGNRPCFLADRLVGDVPAAMRESRYRFPEVTKSKGTLESWLQVIEQEVLGNPCLELGLAIGASAPIAFLLRESKVFAEVPIWSLIGLSSTGKTTVLRLMASIYGSPEEGSGLIKDFNATENAFFTMLGNNTGMPHLIDEATCKPNWDFSSIVYRLSKGQDKARCMSTGDLRQRIKFSGAVVVSGENSLLDQSRDTLGMHARLVELTLPWTYDAGNASRLSTGVRRNYGTAVYPFVEVLLILCDKHPEVLERLFYNELDLLKQESGEISGVDERPYHMFATVMVAIIILQNVFNIRLQKRNIRRLLLNHYKSKAPERTVEERLYDHIIDAAVTHGKFFPKRSGKGKNQLLPDTLWGEYATRNMQEVLWITAETFRQFAEEAQCPNYRQFLSKMRDKGLLVDFGDGHYRQKHELGHGKPLCYCLKLNETHLTTKQKKQPVKKRSPHPDLLREDEGDNEER